MSQWHYIDAQAQAVGPLESSQIAELVARGVLDGDSKVWYPGWPNWAPLSLAWQSVGLAAPPPAKSLPPPRVQMPAGSPAALLAPGQNPWSISGFAGKVTDLVGLERIEGFSSSEMLSSVFKKYGDDAIEAHFSVGTKETTPSLNNVTTKWPKPWMFARTLLLALILYAGFYVAVAFFGASIAIPAMIITGSFAVPIASVIFFFEMNAPQNVSMYQVIKLILLGGVISILFSLLLFEASILDDLIGAPSAGVIEELGKLVTVLILARNLDPQRYPYVTNGMLFGAAVGAGFAAFESAGYAFMAMMSADNFQAAFYNANESIVLRGLLAPFGHVAWTAIAAGAVWSAKGAERLSLGHVFTKQAMPLIVAAMALHFTWNLPFAGPFLLKYWVLGFIAYVLVFALLQKGLRLVRSARNVTHTMTRGISLAEVQAALRARNQ